MIYVIGPCVLDTGRFEVRREGRSVAVEPQVFDLLVLLLENRDRIVTRDEIIEKVWKGRIVSDAAISSRIKAARRVIGDDGKSQSLIRTIHRRGIRFVGGVATEPVPALAEQAARPVDPTTSEVMSGRTQHGIGQPSRAVELWVPKDGEDRGDDDSAAGLDLSLPKQPSLVVLPFQHDDGT